MYMTKTWGFGWPTGPLQFSERGWRDRALRVLQDGDLVTIVGTMGENTPADERGKILGLMEPTKITVSALDYQIAQGNRDYDDKGNYRWPFGLELRHAWRFLKPQTSLSDISSRQFTMDSALGIVPLSPDEASRILELPMEPVALLQSIRTKASIHGEKATRKMVAPPPSTTREGIMHLRRAPAFTYAMLMEGADQPSIKIGWAFDWKARQDYFNKHSCPTLGGIKYNTIYKQIWDTAMLAYRMEQSILRKFSKFRNSNNTEVINHVSKDDILKEWTEYIFKNK